MRTIRIVALIGPGLVGFGVTWLLIQPALIGLADRLYAFGVRP